jgi:thiamine-phosphate pyrophosphorylase
MSAGEAGADYISFGPVSGSLGDGELADHELFDWWSKMIEVPVVAEGGVSTAEAKLLAPVTDFFAVGEEIWNTEDPLAALNSLLEVMG